MNRKARKAAWFGLMTALTLVLGLMDRAIPLSALLGGAIPGVKLGLANTVLLYAIYMMDVPGCWLLMLAKVLLSGFLYGSLSAVLYSLSGGVLSLAVMLLVRKNPGRGALAAGLMALLADFLLLLRVKTPRGPMLWCVILIAVGGAASLVLWRAIRNRPEFSVMGTSVAGAVAHNAGQMLTAAAVLHTPQLLMTYLPVLLGLGALVGSLTGIVAQRVFHALGKNGGRPMGAGEFLPKNEQRKK